MKKNKENREKFLDRQNKQQRRNSRYNHFDENKADKSKESNKPDI